MSKSEISEITYKSGRKEKFYVVTKQKTQNNSAASVETKFVVKDAQKEFVVVNNDGKSRKVLENNNKGHLDHYTSYKFKVEEGLQHHSNQIIMESFFWSKNYE